MKQLVEKYLKPGYIWEKEDGSMYAVFTNIKGTSFLCDPKTGLWNDKYGIVHGSTQYVKIYSITHPGTSDIFLRSDSKENTFRKLVWQKEKPIVELTVDQIAEKFGIEVECLRIKK